MRALRHFKVNPVLKIDETVYKQAESMRNTDSISVLAQADPIFSFLAVVHAYCLAFKLGSGATVALVFSAFKHAFKACFLGWHFLTTNISLLWRLNVRPTFCSIYNYVQKS